MDTTKIYDYFKGAEHKRSNGDIGKNDLEEKRQQQRFYIENNIFKDGIFVYDMEFAQEYEDEEKKKADLDKMGIESSNQTDCLGIRFDKDRNPVSLVFVEIKSKESSVKQAKSGLRDHLKKMDAYLTIREGETIEDTHIIDRVEEAKEIIECYRALELRNIPKKFRVDSLDVLKELSRQEVLLVFTGEEEDGAINYCFKKGRENTIEWIDPYMNKEYRLNWWPNLM